MNNSILKQAADFLKNKKKARRWLVLFLCLAVAVTTGTLAALKKNGQAMTPKEHILACSYEVHQHTDKCYKTTNGKKELVCGYADYVVHSHNEDCYDDSGVLVCQLKEVKEHKHDDSCYETQKVLSCGKEESEGHTHGDSCYETKKVLSCGKEEAEGHTHGDSCYETKKVLSCGKEESADHTHSDACYTEEKTLVCGKEESEGHTHGDDCYTEEKTLVCGKEESKGHTHDASCYSEEKVLVCKELELHTHTDKCYETLKGVDKDKDGKDDKQLICGKLELKEHMHGEDCFQIVEAKAGDDNGGGLLPQTADDPEPEKNTADGSEPSADNGKNAGQQETNEDSGEGVTAGNTVETKAPEGNSITGTSSIGNDNNNTKVIDASNGQGDESGDGGDNGDGGSTDGDETPDGQPINLNELGEGEVTLTFQYKDEDGTWQNIPDGKNIFNYYNSDISINFQFTKEFTQAELKNSGGTLTYELPPYLKDFSKGQIGVLLDQNKKEAGKVTVDENGKVTIQLYEEFMKDNDSASDLHFTLSGRVNLEKATEKEVGDKNYPGFELVLPKDEREAQSQYGTLELQKKCISDAPQRDKTTGDWYVDYELTVTAPDLDMPDVRVEDVFNLNSNDQNVKKRLQGLIDAYVKYSVDNGSEKQVGNEAIKTPDSVYQIVDDDGVPHLNWYLGEMKAKESRTLHYRVRLKQDKMETTNFTADGTILPNMAEAFSQTYPKANDDVDLSIKTSVYVSKLAQENPEYQNSDPKVYFVPDGNGGGYIEYKVTVKNDKEYPVNVKVYDSVNDPNANTSNNNNANKGKGLSYDQNSFKFTLPSNWAGDTPPNVDFSKEGDRYTSFTAHIGWLQPQETVTFTYRLNISAEELAAGKVDVNNGVLALFEGQEKTGDTYQTWLNRYQQNHTVEQESWAKKNYGGEVSEKTITFEASDAVYDATKKPVTKMENPDSSFTLGENSFQYTVTVNGNTVWDVSSATMGDRLSNGLQYSGYVQVVAKRDGQVLGTAWVKVDGLKEFSFTGEDIGFVGGEFGVGTSYELTYYTTVDKDNKNVHIVLGNDFSMGGTITGPGGKIINVNVQDSTSNMGETSSHLKVTKDAWYYEPNTDTNLGAFYWVVKVDASYIPNGFALRDAAGEKHELHDDSLLGVYTGPAYDFSKVPDWATFQQSADEKGFANFSRYSDQFTKENGLTVTFGQGDYTPSEGQYVYLFFKTCVTERQADPYENKVYSNGDNIPGTNVDYFEDDATSNLPDVGDVEKVGMQVFDWDGSSNITMLGETKNPADYNLDASVLSGGSVPAGRYAAWSVSVNKKGTMEGDYTITDQIPEGTELSFVAIAKTVNILQDNTNNTPPWAILLHDGGGESGLLVGHAKTNQDEYKTGQPDIGRWDASEKWKPWTADNWKYYPSADGRTVSWGVHIEDGMCIGNDNAGEYKDKPFSAYEVDYLVVCRVTDPDVLLGVTTGDPQKIFNNQVTVYDENHNPVAEAKAPLTVPCKPVVTKEGLQDEEGGHMQQTIKFTLKVNEEATMVEGVGETLTLKDEMSENLSLVPDSVKFYSDKDCTKELTEEEGVSFTPPVDNVITFTIPNGKAVFIRYDCEINEAASKDVEVKNTVYFEDRNPDDQGETWKKEVHYDPTGGISGNKKMQITKTDKSGKFYLPGAEFEVTLLGTKKDQGVYEPRTSIETFSLVTDENGVCSITTIDGGLYKIVETHAPVGYVIDKTPRYYWVGKGSNPPTPEEAELDADTKINPMYTSVINVVITNEMAEITVTKEFKNASGQKMSEVTGEYTFGLFKKENDSYEKVKDFYGNSEQTLKYPDDIDKKLTFYVPYTKEGEPQVEYYIFELDEEGNPIETGSRSWVQTDTSGTWQFEPSYQYGNGENETASSAVPVTDVTVTNTCYTAYELPESGGIGTAAPYTVGALLALGAIGALLYTTQKRRKEGN